MWKRREALEALTFEAVLGEIFSDKLCIAQHDLFSRKKAEGYFIKYQEHIRKEK